MGGVIKARSVALIALFLCASLLLGAEQAAIFHQADAYYNAGKYDAAIGEYSRVLALNLSPHQASRGTMARGICYYAKHDPDRAIADFNHAIGLDPRNAGAYVNRGNALQMRGERSAALKDYTTALRLNSRNSSAYVGRGLVRAQNGDFTGALSDYNTALKINPRSAFAHIGRASIYYLQAIPERSLSEAQAAIALSPGDAEAYILRAHAYMELRRYSDAEADIHKAMHMKNVEFSGALEFLAWFRATCPDPHFRNGREAVEAAQRYCQQTETGDFGAAVKAETQAIEKAPSQDPLMGQFKHRLELYKQQTPYRDEPRGKVSWH